MDMKSEDHFERNMSYFKDKMPDIYARFLKFEPESKFVFDDDGEPDLEIGGERLYGLGAKKLVDKQIHRFKNSDVRLKIQPISSSNVDIISRKLLYRFMERAVDAGISFGRWNHSKNAYHVISLGCGLGLHLEALVEETQCVNLIVIEPNVEFFYQSLHCFNWEGFVERLLGEERSLNIVLEDNYDDLIIRIRTLFIRNNPVSYDGSRIFIHYDNPVLRKVNNFFAKESMILLQGWGFFDDEINMIANTHANLSSGKEVLYQRKNTRQDFPIFIVGSGPSLDDDIDVIRENSDRAVIVSCGTALRPLLYSGIVPDFHMELERGPGPSLVLGELIKEFDVSNIMLVASTTCQPKLHEFFKKRIYYFREPLSSFPLFGKSIDSCIRLPSPTVSNVGLSFAQDLGFREYYFFGVDLGVRDSTKHHSKNTFYFAENLDIPYESTKTYKGNFGGAIFTSDVLSWTKDNIEGAIRLFTMGHAYYNCSNGAAIKGTLPKLASKLSLKEPVKSKQDFIKELINEFLLYSEEDFHDHWKPEQFIDSIQEITQEFIDILEQSTELRSKKYLTSLMKILQPFTYFDTTRMVIGGSLLVILMTGEYYLDRVMEEDKLDLMGEIVKDEYIRILKEMRDQAIAEIKSIDTGEKFEDSMIYYDD